METESETREASISTAWNQAHIINDAIDSNDLSTREASDALNYEELIPKILHTKMFVELPTERLRDGQTQGQALKELLHQQYDQDHKIIDTLAKNNVNLAIAMQEGFEDDPYLVECLKELNEKGLNPTLWLVLSDELGYWTNKANVQQSIDKLERLLNWKDVHGIKIDKIGLDYEPPLEFTKGLVSKNIPKMFKELIEYFRQAKVNKKEFGNLQNYLNYSLAILASTNHIPIETYASTQPLRTFSNLLTFKPSPGSDIVTMAYSSALKKELGEDAESVNRYFTQRGAFSAESAIEISEKNLKSIGFKNLSVKELQEKYLFVKETNGKFWIDRNILKQMDEDLNKGLDKKIQWLLNKIDKDEIPALGIVGSDPYNTPGRDLRESLEGQKKPEKHLSKKELTENFRALLGRDNFGSPIRESYVFALDGDTLEDVLDARKNAIKEE